MDKKVYGIDLGTTNSAIAVFVQGEAQIIKNIDGQEITPSVVLFEGVSSSGNDETIVGLTAKMAAATNPDNVVQFVKRRMGKSGQVYNFTAPSGKEYTPEMISAFILRKLCQDAEEYEGAGSVKNVVITVPAYFDDARRTATKQAGAMAGLNVLTVVNEPTAAAIAYGVDTSKQGKVLVYDLGGGTFDVTVMDINNGRFDVVATGGDHELGGLNFDQRLIKLITESLAGQGITVDDEDDAALNEIREMAEVVKKQLSRVETARPAITINGKRVKIEITRDAFEKASEDLVARTQLLLEEVLKEKRLSWRDIDELLLIGGSTRMPMIKKMLERISGKEVTYKVDPDTAVARGAAIFASTFKPTNPSVAIDADKVAQNIVVSDVTSQSLGVISVDDTGRKINSIIIPHNTKIPTRRSEIFYTVQEMQTQVMVEVTEGDETEVEFVKIIGHSILSIPPYPKGSPIEVAFIYDADQTVAVEVVDKTTNQSLGRFQIERQSNLTDDQVKKATDIIRKSDVE